MMDKKGMTLVEVLVTLLITGIVLSAVYFLFIRVTLMNKEQQEYVKAQEGLRVSMLLVEKDIRRSSQSLELKEEMGCYLLSDQEDPDNPIVFRYCVIDGKFTRNDQVIMDGVDSLEITFNNFYIEVSFTGSFGRKEFEHEKKIYLRSASR